MKIVIITDMTFDIEKGRLREYSKRGRDAIEKAGATLIIHPHIHSKTICVDQKILMEGSFNWLSASRDKDYANKESTILLEGEVSSYIEKVKTNLNIKF